jgi:predicted DNA-binding transcriptional regulator YafY
MNRGRQILRQWQILRALEHSQNGLKIEQIRKVVEDECTVRTLYRDLEQLQEAGFPLVDENGLWKLPRALGYNIPVQNTEIFALALTESLLEPVRGTWLHNPISSLRTRLLALLTPIGREWLKEVRHTAIATLAAPGNYQEYAVQIEAIDDAIQRQHRLTIHYHAPGKEVEQRMIEPYTTWFHGGRLYLIARCLKAEDYRTFAIQRIEKAAVEDISFEHDDSFDVEAFIKRGFGVFQGPIHRVVIDFSSEVAHLAHERNFHHSQQLHSRVDGTTRLVMECAGLPEIAAWLAGFGGKAWPVAPGELVGLVRGLHEAGLKSLR